MREKVQQQGLTVVQAAKQVYGRVADYYETTTPQERETVYCKPCKNPTIRQISFDVRCDVADKFAAACKANGKSQNRVLTTLVVEYIRLNPVADK